MKLKKMIALGMVSMMTLALLGGCANQEGTSSTVTTEGEEAVTLTLLKDSDNATAGLEAVVALAQEKLGIVVEIEERVGGAEGDNLIKTRLASGDMADLCLYNSGAKFAALNPKEYFIDISNEEFVNRLDDTYRETVTVADAVYGIPFSSTQAGVMLYNKDIYEELNLEVPKTWDEFLENCQVIKDAGQTALIGTFGDSWTSQLIFLADHYAVEKSNPNFAEEFEAGIAKYETTPSAVASFQKYVDTINFYNEDYLAATYSDGIDMLVNGDGAHWCMLSQALGSAYDLYPDELNKVGAFAIPGETQEETGLTAWMPGSLYGNKNSEHQEAILKFMEFYVSDEALDAYTAAVLPDGPYAIKGYELPDEAYDAVKIDIQWYYDNNKVVSALEFKTSVKGANCEAITQEVATGQISAEEAARAYDEDCLKQAVQLGLDWK